MARYGFPWKRRQNQNKRIVIFFAMSCITMPFGLLLTQTKNSDVNENQSLINLRTKAYQSSSTWERIEIFDYLLKKDYTFGINALFEFFKFLDDSCHNNTQELDLLQKATQQSRFPKIKEWCLWRLAMFEVRQGRIENALSYLDSLNILFPGSKWFKQEDYDKLSNLILRVKQIKSDDSIDEPTRLWLLGKAYWVIGDLYYSGVCGGHRIAYKYFYELLHNYPESPYCVNAKYTMMEYEYAVSEPWDDTTCGLARAKKYQALLRRYPETTIRDEVLLTIIWVYLCKVRTHMDQPNIAREYLNKAEKYLSHLTALRSKKKKVISGIQQVKKLIKKYRVQLEK